MVSKSNINPEEILKILMFTDIHWGAKNNSTQHNQDNTDYVDWLIEIVKDKQPSHLCFLGDWFENRNAINIKTSEYAYVALKKLNALGIPIIFIVGNHDIYYRDSRDIYSTNIYREFNNVTIIDESLSIGKFLFMPYIFPSEYPKYVGLINSHKYVFGHFEFKNFIVSGLNMKMKTGANNDQFKVPKYIFTGHFHKRQAGGNVRYIGNTFPTNFADIDDTHRGCCLFDVKSDKVTFIDWPDLPTYHKITLSKLLTDQWNPKSKMRVKCEVDIDISYSEAQLIKEATMKEFNLRELRLEENLDKQDALIEGDDNIDNNMTINDIVISSISTIEDVNNIDNDRLISIYNNLSEE